jgi:hypothetical protein
MEITWKMPPTIDKSDTCNYKKLKTCTCNLEKSRDESYNHENYTMKFEKLTQINLTSWNAQKVFHINILQGHNTNPFWANGHNTQGL